MTTPREIIARHLCTMAAQGWSAISPFERAAYRTTAAGMVEALTAAGFRIVGPEEVDPVTEAMELARAVLAQSITAGHNVPGPTPEDIEKAFWALDAALAAKD